MCSRFMLIFQICATDRTEVWIELLSPGNEWNFPSHPMNSLPCEEYVRQFVYMSDHQRRVDQILIRHRWIALLFLLSAVLVVYGPYADNPFVMDDVLQIQENRLIRSFENLSQIFMGSTMENSGSSRNSGIYYKPLMTTYFAIMWALGGKDGQMWILRLPIFFLQAGGAYFIYLLSLEFFAASVALLLALFFLLHPVNAEMVLYLADAQDVLYFFFGLSVLVLIQKLRDRSRWILGILCFIGLACALLSKETGALFMPISILWAWTIDRRAVRPLAIASVILTLGYAYLRTAIGLTVTTSSAWLFHQISFWQRLSMVPMILAHDLEILLVPLRISLSTDFVLTELSFANFMLPLLVVLGFLYLLIFWARRLVVREGSGPAFDFYLGVLFFWFVLHGQIFLPLDAVYADRWLCLVIWAMLSLSFLFLRAFTNERRTGFVGHFSQARIVMMSSILLLGIYVWRDIVRAQDFSSPLRLYKREAELHPWDAIMANNVGVELFKAGDWQAAEPYFVKATDLNPGWSVAWNNRGAIAERRQDPVQGLEFYRKSLSLDYYGLAYENYARLLYRLGREEECRAFVKEALVKFPYNSTLQEVARAVGL